MDEFLKVFIDFDTMLLLFSILVFLISRQCGILAPRSGWILHPLRWKAEFLSTGPARKSVTHCCLSGLLLLKAGVFQVALVVKKPPAQAGRFERPGF